MVEPRLAGEQDSRLTGDLREHRRADRSLGAGAGEQIAELGDAGSLAFNPLVDRDIGLLGPPPRQEVDAQLLEVAG